MKTHKTKQKIAFIGQKGIPARSGGIERHVEAIATRLAKKRDFVVLVYCRHWYVRGEVKGQRSKVKSIFVPSIHTKHLDTITHVLFSTLHALFIAKVNIIHYHGVGPALVAWLPRLLKPQVKIVITFHCIDRKHGKWGQTARMCLRMGEWCATRLAHETIAVSQTLRQYIRDVYDREARYIPNGVEITGENGREGAVLARLGLKHHSYILTVARLVPHKRVSDLIVAFQKLNPPDLQLVIVGAGSFTDKYLEELSVLIGHDERICLVGEQSAQVVRALMRHCRVFVQPSVSEGLPLVVLEALSEGALVLASDIPEQEEILQNGKYGLSFQAGNIEALSRGLKKVLALSKEQRRELRRAGLVLVKRAYDWNQITEEIAETYNEIETNHLAAPRVAYSTR